MKVTASELAAMTASNDFTVVHIDANWDGCRSPVEEKMRQLDARKLEGVACAYIDCDQEGGYVDAIGLRNVPAVAYYRGTGLVAVLVGKDQNIAENLKITISGGTPGLPKR